MDEDEVPLFIRKLVGHIAGIVFVGMLSLSALLTYFFFTKSSNFISFVLILVSLALSAYLGVASLKLTESIEGGNKPLVPLIVYRLLSYTFLLSGGCGVAACVYQLIFGIPNLTTWLWLVAGGLGGLYLSRLCLQASRSKAGRQLDRT